MNNIIPNNFLIGACEFNTHMVEDIDDTGLGRSTECLGIIKLAKEWQGKELPKSSIEKTFFHELLHMFFDAIGEKELSDNERLVDSLSLLLHQYIKENYILKNE